MFWGIIRMFWVLWVTTVCLHYCSMTHVPVAHASDSTLEKIFEEGYQARQKPKPKQPTVHRMEYVVAAGDTLGSIAAKYRMTWQQVWDINRDRIADPNIIHIGQKIRIRGAEIVVPPKPQMTREQKIDKLARFMFSKAGLVYEDEETLALSIQGCRKSLAYSNLFDFDNQRRIMDKYYPLTRKYEIWLLATAIVDNTQSDDEFYKLVGLVWQETQFVNRRGKHNERGFYRFLPSTVKWWKGVDDIGLVNVLYEVENNPDAATKLALDMLRKNKWNWNWWNHGINYEYQLNNKIYWFKTEWRK